MIADDLARLAEQIARDTWGQPCPECHSPADCHADCTRPNEPCSLGVNDGCDTSRQHWHYRDCTIVYDPPPIPIRSLDWEWASDEYDGPEDTGRTGRAASLDACRRGIDEAWEEGRML